MQPHRLCESVWNCRDWSRHCSVRLTRCSQQTEQDSEEEGARLKTIKFSYMSKSGVKYWGDSITMNLYNEGLFIKYFTLTSGGTPPTKNTVLLSISNSESLPGASPFWMNFCSSVELWLGMVRKTFPCLPSLQAWSTKKHEKPKSSNQQLAFTH